ncbi:sensor histidine kinase [Streptomyces sp. LaPpAH-108]|uniref:sensor histidine kinase n=1 Tax=Streptomyces sp. LaPpAH-108 TaxID=1155714 RepID=UPI000361F36E|nr:histidine kinase [Streptomyces sp. LaPpAH-108]
MLGHARRLRQRHWRERSKAERVELTTVVMWYLTPWLLSLVWLVAPVLGSMAHQPLPLVLDWVLLLAGTLQCAEANRLTWAAFDHYLGRAVLPPRALWGSWALLAATLAAALALTALGRGEGAVPGLAIGAALMAFGLPYGMVTSVRAYLRQSGALAVLLMAAFGLASPDVAGLIGIGAVTVFSALFSLAACRCGAWTLSVLWEAERARETEARLAVAEERLRFGRDLHDVLGRNLSVISLKSELAVQLARRGRPEAMEQMIEVQRIAQESQREVREVVRGYREADLGVELAGAQGVLTAAGIVCEVRAETAELPAPVQSALGWVVREAATNVLRHGDAQRCAVAVRVREGRAVLTVENDGAGALPGGSGGGGSGLAGLRERLAAVGGTLEAGAAEGDRFRLVAEVPLCRTVPTAEVRQVSEVAS